MKKKLSITLLALATVAVFTACNNASNETKEAGKEEKHNEADGHKHDTTHKNNTDTLGMKMGGNELDSKKK